jgi:hypothetical protein
MLMIRKSAFLRLLIAYSLRVNVSFYAASRLALVIFLTFVV